MATLTTAEHLGLLVAGLAKVVAVPVGHLLCRLYWRCQLVGLGVGGTATALLAAFVAFDRRREPRMGFASSSLRWLGLTCCAQALVLAWSSPGDISRAYPWYLRPEFLVLVIGPCVVLANSQDRGNAVYRAAAWLVAGLRGALIAAYDMNNVIDSYASCPAIIERVRQPILTYVCKRTWDAGFNAYWLQPQMVVNLDRMANSRGYVDQVIKPSDYLGYFATLRIECILNMAPDTEAQQLSSQQVIPGGVRRAIVLRRDRSNAIPAPGLPVPRCGMKCLTRS